jgi:precorrin-6A/cobalt-precorrin-6A reductase
VLILGGTFEARDLAVRLAGLGAVRVISSLAGRVREPVLPAGEVRIGGFGGTAGLAGWMAANDVAAVVDATHPFAEAISAHAAAACARAGIPILSVVRPPWSPGAGDNWHEVASLSEAAARLPALGERIFLTTGRSGLACFAELDLWFLIRCVDAPDSPLPRRCQILLARGPYDAGAELTLMREHSIDMLVTKNSGGELTAGKLHAARQLGIPVIMVARPVLQDVPTCESAADAESWLLRRLRRNAAG